MVCVCMQAILHTTYIFYYIICLFNISKKSSTPTSRPTKIYFVGRTGVPVSNSRLLKAASLHPRSRLYAHIKAHYDLLRWTLLFFPDRCC